MRTMPRLTSLAALVALTIGSTAPADGSEPVSLVAPDLDWVTAGSAEALRALSDDDGRAGVATFTDRARAGDGGAAADGSPFQAASRTGTVQADRQAAASLSALAAGGRTAPAETPQLGVPGTVLLSSLTNGINGNDGMAGPLGSSAALGALLSLESAAADRPSLSGTSGGGVAVLESGSGGAPGAMMAAPGRLLGSEFNFLRLTPPAAVPFLQLPPAFSRFTAATR